MQQEKMGCLIRELRKEKGLTQEQMAEIFGVTNRTVSRWEKGTNMPDISILVEISNYFEIGILELIEGERGQEKMTTENNDELKQIAKCADEQKRIILKKVRISDLIAFICCVTSCVAMSAYKEFHYPIVALLQVMPTVVVLGMLLYNICYTTGIIDSYHSVLRKKPIVRCVAIILAIIIIISLCIDIYMILTGGLVLL